MGQFSHKNVVKLHGVVTVGDPVSYLSTVSLTAILSLGYDGTRTNAQGRSEDLFA